MNIQRVWAVYFSPTHTTKKVVTAAAGALAEGLGAPVAVWDFTLPASRRGWPEFLPTDAVVLGVPTYAGLVPGQLTGHLAALVGNGAAAVPVVTYGNRDFDDALIQLRDILADGGFQPFAAGAFVGEHSFSTILAAGRPDDEDLALARQLGRQAAEKLAGAEGTLPLVAVDGVPRPYRGQYQPRDRQGNPVNFREAHPLTSDACNRCGLCAAICPMGAIDPTDPTVQVGPCAKCGACVKSCPQAARYYDNEAYLSHTRQLEEDHVRRGAVKLYL